MQLLMHSSVKWNSAPLYPTTLKKSDKFLVPSAIYNHKGINEIKGTSNLVQQGPICLFLFFFLYVCLFG